MNPARRALPSAVRPAAAVVPALLAAAVPLAAAGAQPVSRGVVQTLLALSIAGVLGIVAVAALDRAGSEEQRGRLLDLAASLAATWTVLAAGTAFLLYLGEAPAIDSPTFGPGLVAFVADVAIGRTWAIAAACAAVLTALLVAVRSRAGVRALLVASLLAAIPVALQSAMAGEALDAARVLDAAGFVQLVALGIWLGALAVGAAGVALPVAAAGAVALGSAAALPALLADGAVDPVAAGGAVAVGLAGLLTVVTAASGRRTGVLQLVLVAVGIGLGIAGSIGRTMPEVPARTTPAQILTGSSLPAASSIGSVFGAWLPDPLWAVVAVGLLAGYAVAVRRRTAWPVRRTVSWVLGLLLLVWLTSGAPAAYATTLLPALLVQQAGLLLAVPLLLAGGRPREVVGRTAVARRGVVGAIVAVLVPLLLLGTGVVRWNVTDPLGREVACGAVLVAGSLLVAALTGTGPTRRTAIVIAAALLVVETGVAAVLAIGPGLLLADWYGAMGWGTDALQVQRSAALPVWLLVVVPTLLMLVRALRSAPSASPAAPQAVVV